MHINQFTRILLFCFLGIQTAPLLSAGEPLLVYSHRHYAADDTLFQSFTKQTGIPVRVIKAGASELLERLKREGADTPADILITADAGRLEDAKAAGLLASVDSPVLAQRIPPSYRDPEGHWFGFTMRARVLVYHPGRVQPADLSTYEALAHPEWKGRILCRSSSNIYNQSLLGSLVAAHGQAEALSWARSVRANMARPPQGSDRDQIRAVAAGLGDVAIVNTYYLGLLLNSPDPRDRKAAEQVRIFFPNQQGRGTHVNVSGAGILAASDQQEAAKALLEFLASDEAQRVFPLTTYEYPVVEGIPGSALQTRWGDFKADPLNLSTLGELNTQAVKLFNRAGWE